MRVYNEYVEIIKSKTMNFIPHDSSSSSQTYYVFEPEANITAYEIAKLLPILTAARKNSNEDVYKMAQSIKIPSELKPQIEKLDENFRRHFTQYT